MSTSLPETLRTLIFLIAFIFAQVFRDWEPDEPLSPRFRPHVLQFRYNQNGYIIF